MSLNPNQEKVKQAIENFASLLDVDPNWACAIAMVESSLGENRISRTNCRGVFQMSSIAMEDLRQQMGLPDDDLIGIVCGLLFLRLLYQRWGTLDEATNHFCDPNDRGFYLNRVLGYMQSLNQPAIPAAAEETELKPVQPPAKSWWEKLWG